MAPNQEGHREENRVRSDCLRHEGPCRCSASMTPVQEEQQERQKTLQRQEAKSMWEAGHRVLVNAQLDFQGDPRTRQYFPLLEDQNIVARTSEFLAEREGPGNGTSAERFVTLQTLDQVDGHGHPNIPCQILMMSCSSEALIKIKRDPFMEEHDNSFDFLSGSNTSNTTNEDGEVRVE